MSGGAGCRDVAAWLDDFLRVGEIEDYPGALNGLQLEGHREVRHIGAATDACLASIDRAIEADCDMLLVHHGLFWGGPAPLTGPAYERVRRLVESGMALYSSHLPLDMHPEAGNNVLLGRRIGLKEAVPFGSAMGNDGIGVMGTVAVSRDGLADRVSKVCGQKALVIPGGPERVSKLALATGSAASLIGSAVAAGADTFLTGEGTHHSYHEAMELGINVIYAGHYATETFGARALAERTAARFGATHSFFDLPTGL